MAACDMTPGKEVQTASPSSYRLDMPGCGIFVIALQPNFDTIRLFLDKHSCTVLPWYTETSNGEPDLVLLRRYCTRNYA